MEFISFFFYFYACLCHIELHFCVRNQGNYFMERKIFENDRLGQLRLMYTEKNCGGFNDWVCCF